jgi:uncharacterized protein YaiI (UPF0178 family)
MGRMHTLYLDADSCSVKEESYRVASRYALRVAVVANAPLRVPANERVELVVRPGFGAADDWIAEQAGSGDVVVTADVPLAARCLAKGALVLGPGATRSRTTTSAPPWQRATCSTCSARGAPSPAGRRL